MKFLHPFRISASQLFSCPAGGYRRQNESFHRSPIPRLPAGIARGIGSCQCEKLAALRQEWSERKQSDIDASLKGELFGSESVRRADRDIRYHPEASEGFLSHFLIPSSSFFLFRSPTTRGASRSCSSRRTMSLSYRRPKTMCAVMGGTRSDPRDEDEGKSTRLKRRHRLGTIILRPFWSDQRRYRSGSNACPL